MLREAAGTQPKVYARYEFGREVSEDLAGRLFLVFCVVWFTVYGLSGMGMSFGGFFGLGGNIRKG